MFVEALLPITSALENLTRQDRIINEMKQNNDLAQKRADTARLNAENRKRELDIIEKKMQPAQIQQAYGGVHLQMQPVHDGDREYVGKYPSFDDVDGKIVIGNYTYGEE